MGTLRLGDRPVRRIGLGTNRLQTIGQPEATRLLQRASELGVDMVDTADVYGDTLSESRIGAALADLRRVRPLVATKGGMVRTPAGAAFDGSRAHLRAALDASLRRLGVARVDLYYLHRVDPRVPIAESVRALAELRDDGKIGHIGVSNVTLAQLEEARAVAPIAAVQNKYHLGDRASEDVLRACETHGIVFVPWYPINKNAVAEDDAVMAVAQRARATPTQVALAWLLQRSPVMLPIPGTTSRAHLEENVRALHVKLAREDVAQLDEAALA